MNIVGSMQRRISGFERHAKVTLEGSIPLSTAKIFHYNGKYDKFFP